MCLRIIHEKPENVRKYKSGKDRVFKWFIEQAMKECKGAGNTVKIDWQFLEIFAKHEEVASKE